MTRAHHTPSEVFSFRIPGLMIAACCLVLAGCAAPRQSADVFIIDDQDIALASLSNDPIGALAKSTGKRSLARQPAAGAPIIDEALDLIGIRYRYGGSSPETGFDCSGFVAYTAERALGLKLPRNAAAIASIGANVDKPHLQPGDLVFFNTLGRRYSHVGIYLGDNRFVHSPSAGGAVRIESMTMAYWSKRYNGARRLDGNYVAAAGASRR
jgi:cell wall-associated NlpC family hydrolase